MKRALLLLVFAFPAITLGSDRTVQRAFEVADDTRLELRAHKGTIHIETGDSDSIQMTARIHSPIEGSTRDLEHVEIRTSSGDRWVKIVVVYDRDGLQREAVEGSSMVSDWDSTSLPFVDFFLVVPRTASLDLESHKSSFDVRAPSGEVKISTHKGNGKLVDVRNDLALSSYKGDFEVEIVEMRDVEIETRKGEIGVTVHGATDFRVHGETHKGHLEFEGHDIQTHRNDDRGLSVSETVGSGRHEIRLETYKGEIKLDFRN